MWFLYILECSDNSYYTGITKNLEKRIATHNKGLGSKYTRSRLPCKFVSTCKVSDKKSDALKIEYRFKQLSRSEKKNEIQKGIEIFVSKHLDLLSRVIFRS